MAKCILIIDDDHAGQDEVRKELESDCTEVICVESVQEALQTFLSREFALVILNADLSECDGYSLLEVMQTAKPIPILALSSRQRKNHEEIDFLKHEADAHPEVPYSLRDSLKLAKRAICHYEPDADESQAADSLLCGCRKRAGASLHHPA